MKLEDALAQFGADSPYRTILPLLLSEDPKTRTEGSKEIRNANLTAPMYVAAPAKEPAVAMAVLRSALELSFPPPATDWERCRDELLFTILGSAHPPVLEYIRDQFASADPALHLSLLTLVASASTREGAKLFVDLIASHGWPRRCHGRFFAELSSNLDHADVLFPALLEKDDGPRMGVGNLVLSALRGDKIGAQAIANTPFVLGLDTRLRTLMAKYRAVVDETSDEFSEEAAHIGGELAMFIDVAGFVDTPAPVLQDAAAFANTRVAAFAVASLLRREQDVEVSHFARIAADHASRDTFYTLLDGLGAASKIPAIWRTRDAFAAAEMVGWLAHPAELGRPPDELEKMAVFEGHEEGEPIVLYVWRFRVGDETWKAGVSGSYPAIPPEGSLGGRHTFSRFDDWDSASPEEHALAVVKTLNEWSRARAD